MRVISVKMGNQSRWTRIMEEHAGISMCDDCWGTAHEGAGRSKFPIFQEQQIFPSGTLGPMESCRPDICTRQRISLHRDSEFFLERCFFYYIFYFSDTVFFMSYKAMLFLYEELLSIIQSLGLGQASPVIRRM